MSTPACDPAEDALDPAAQRAERRLALLEEMAAIGMRILRRLDDDRASDPDSVDAFARISRAVRLTLALEEKTDRFLADLRAGVVKPRQEAQPDAPAACFTEPSAAAHNASKARAFDLICAVSETEGESLESFEALCEALVEPLEEDERAARRDWNHAPTIERLCRDIGLTPELSGRIAEGWRAGYLASRPRFNPWRSRSLPAEVRRAGLDLPPCNGGSAGDAGVGGLGHAPEPSLAGPAPPG